MARSAVQRSASSGFVYQLASTPSASRWWLTGWTWVLCGLASAIAWLALPLDYAEIAAIVLVITAIVVTIIHLVRLAGRARTSALRD